ncbi:hypothetical protein [Kribbella sp. NPDC023855]|uniref:hypothetical protein n=1 Tax=Kribbella sp. NPDC023855 TaxID=3154698 RepID=UPI0034023360
MSTPGDAPHPGSTQGPEMLHELHHEVELDLAMITASEPDRVLPVSEWLVDPTEVERDQVALRSLLGAVEAMENETPHPNGS